MPFTPNTAMDDEITFLSGVTSSGTVGATSFWTWNQDTPATYSSSQSYAAKWGSNVAGTSGGVVTYSFDAAANWTPTEEAAFASTYALWAAVANISFQMVAPGAAADVVISRGTGSDNSNGGITNLYLGKIGTTRLGQPTAATIDVNTSLYGEGPLGSSFSNFGGYPWQVLLHEEGHTLGLGHAGAYNGTVNSSTSQYGVYDAREWSIMSYIDTTDTSQADYAQEPVQSNDWSASLSTDGTHSYNGSTTWMPLDILAIQRLYGLPVTTPLSGGQTFGFNSNIVGAIEPFFDFTQNTKPIITIWDEGTGNTLDLSGYSMTEVVDLHPGVFDSVGGLTHNVVIAFGVAIDSVIGGTGSEALTANDDGDHLVGNLGNDELGAGLGKDFLDGGPGNDQFNGSKAQLNGDTILDFTFGDTIWIKDGSTSDKYTLSGNKLTWSTGSVTLDNGALGNLVVTTDSAGGVDITLGGGAAASSSLSGGGTLVTTTIGSYVEDQTVYASNGYELYSNFYDYAGRLTKQIGFASDGVQVAEIDHFSDGSSLNLAWNTRGVLVSQAGFAPQGWESYSNIYDSTTGRLIQQLGFASNGVKTAEIDLAADGSSFEQTWTTAGALATLEQFDTAGRPVWKNTYSSAGALIEQDGFAGNGVKIIEIDHGASTSLTTSWTSAGVITQQVSSYNGGGYDFVKTYDSNGHLTEWDVYALNGYRQIETDYATDGSSTVKTYASPGTAIMSQIGYSSAGLETYGNFYDPSTNRLYEQDGFTSGIKTYENDHAADGSSVVKVFNTSAALLSVTGYSTTGQESYANVYDPSTGRLTVQQGFDSNGVKTVEIDHAADGSYTNSQFSSAGLTQETYYDSGGHMLETLNRTPSSGAYSAVGSVAGVTIAAISGTGTLSAGGGATTFAVAQGFGTATVTNFVAAGSAHDFVQVDSHLAADYSHLLADAQNVNGDVVFTFNANDHLTLHGLQIAQLSSNDFLFV